MTERSFIWGGTTIGDSASFAPIDADEFSEIISGLFCFSFDKGYSAASGLANAPSIQLGGVISGHTNELAVSNPAGQDISVASGAAIVEGRLYINSAAYTVTTLAVPASATQYYGIYLVQDGPAQTVRALAFGPYPLASISSLTKDNTLAAGIYYLPLAYVAITSGGVITIYDQRRFLNANCNRVPMLLARQGGDASIIDKGGTTNYDLNNSYEIAVACVKDDAIDSSGFVVMYMLNEYWEQISSPSVIVTVAGADPNILFSVYTFEKKEDAPGANTIHISWRTADGTNAQPTFFVLIFNKAPAFPSLFDQFATLPGV